MKTPTPLHHAAATGDVATLNALLDDGADLDARDAETGHTPLMAACLGEAAGPDAVLLLIEHGADVNATLPHPEQTPAHDSDSTDEPDPDDNLDLLEELNPPDLFPPEMIEFLRKMKSRPRVAPDVPSLMTLAVKEAGIDKLRLLVNHGADVQQVSTAGYNLLTLAACAGRMDVIDLLAEAGAPLDGESSYGESALSVLSRDARFPQIAKLLDRGADPSPLGWNDLMRTTAMGTTNGLEALAPGKDELEEKDRWGRTPFLMAVHAGNIGKAEFLLSRGADGNTTGRCGKTACHYPAVKNDTAMLGWLIDRGFDFDKTDEFGSTPLMEAAEHGSVECFEMLIRNGADRFRKGDTDEPLIRKTTSPAIIRMLVELGDDPALIEAGALRDFIGMGTSPRPDVENADFLRDRTRRFGNANPERMDVPFWKAMVRCGWSGYAATRHFQDEPEGDDDGSCRASGPVWSHDRFGMSLTPLPDGRFIQIGGEHEDHYDPDFCIYNDVFIHDGKGGLEILGYPEDIFPPTDFHSATLIAPWIYIIGNLGYVHTREAHAGQTPVYRFHVENGNIERVITSGESPGWIHSHDAILVDGRIHISGGKILAPDDTGRAVVQPHIRSYVFDPASNKWQQPSP